MEGSQQPGEEKDLQELEEQYLQRIADASAYLPSVFDWQKGASIQDVAVIFQVLPVQRGSAYKVSADLADANSKEITWPEVQKSPNLPKAHGKSLQKHSGSLYVLPLPLSEALQNQLHMALLGESGTGKSTALHFIAHCFAREGLSLEKLGIDEKRVPVWLSLQKVAEGIKTQKGLHQWLTDTVALIGKINLQEAQQLVERWIGSGKLIILLDGLDEVPESLRAEVSSEIRRFADSDGKRSRIIVSSRLAGYVNLGHSFDEYLLQPFTGNEEITSYVLGWISALTPPDALHEAEELAYNLLDRVKTEPGLNAVLKNPLLLLLLISIYVESREIARNQSDLYRLYVEVVAWKRAESRQKSGFSRDEILEALETIAWELHTHGKYPISINSLADAIRTRYDVKDGRGLLQFIHKGMGLLVLRDDVFQEKMDFWHPALREYFVGRFLKKAWNTNPQKTWEFLDPRLHHPDWRQPILFLASELDQENATELVKSILDAKSAYEPELQRDLLLSGACLSNGALLDSEFCSEVIDKLIVSYLRCVNNASDYESPVLQRFVILPLESILKSISGNMYGYAVAKLIEIADGQWKQKISLRARLGKWVTTVGLLITYTFNDLPKTAIFLRSPAYLMRRISNLPSLPKAWDLEVDLYWQNAAIEAIGNLNFNHPDVISVLITALNDTATRMASAESLGKVGPSNGEVAKTIIDTAQKHRREFGWDMTVDKMVEAIGILGQRRPNIVDLLLERVKNQEPTGNDIHYLVTLALCKAAEVNSLAMKFVVEAWMSHRIGRWGIPKRFQSAFSEKGILVEVTEGILEGLKDGDKLIETASPDVIEYLLQVNREFGDSSISTEAMGFLAKVGGKGLPLQGKVVSPEGRFYFKTLDLADTVLSDFLARPHDIYLNAELTLLFRWAHNSPSFAIKLIKSIHDADSWLLARIIEEDIRAYQLHEEEYELFYRVIEELRSPDEAVRKLEFENWSRTHPHRATNDLKLVEFRKWEILSSAYTVLTGNWTRYDPTISLHPIEPSSPYFVAALACFSKRYWPSSEAEAEEIREHTSIAVQRAESILENRSRDAVEVLAPIVLADRGTDKDTNVPYTVSAERIITGYAMAQLSSDYPEAQEILLSSLPSSKLWKNLNDEHDSQKADYQAQLVRSLGFVSNASRKLVEILLDTLESNTYIIHLAGSQSLRRLQNPSQEAFLLLREKYEEQKRNNREDFFRPLTTVDPPTDKVVRLLCKALESNQPEICSVAAARLGDLESPTVTVLNELIKSTENNYHAAEAVGKLVSRITLGETFSLSILEKAATTLQKTLKKAHFHSYAIRRQTSAILVYEALHRVADQLIRTRVASLSNDLILPDSSNIAQDKRERFSLNLRSVFAVALATILGIVSNIIASYLEERYQLISDPVRLIIVVIVFLVTLAAVILTNYNDKSPDG